MTRPVMPHEPRKLKVATVSLAGCFGCHMSFLDIDERLFELIEHIEFDRSPLTDIKQVGHCDIGLIEGGLCNAENVLVLREFRARCKTLVAVGACAITGGLPAQRNRFRRPSIKQARGLLAGEGDGLRPVSQHLFPEGRNIDGKGEGLVVHSCAKLANVGEANAEFQ